MFSSVNLRAPEVVRGVRVLQGYRVLITGLARDRGVDTAQAFAERPTVMALHAAEATQDMVELAAHFSQGEAALSLFGMADEACQGVVAFAQRAAHDMGGFDAVVNFAAFDARDVAALAQGLDVEAIVARKLEPLFSVTEVALNRMRLTLTEGLVLNVVSLDGPRTAALSLLGDVARAMIADVTRGLARDWAKHGIRINAVAPAASLSGLLTGSTQSSNQDVAELALYLAADDEASALTGHVLDAEGYAMRFC